MKAIEVYDLRQQLRRIAKLVEAGMATAREAKELRKMEQKLGDLQVDLYKREANSIFFCRMIESI